MFSPNLVQFALRPSDNTRVGMCPSKTSYPKQAAHWPIEDPIPVKFKTANGGSKVQM